MHAEDLMFASRSFRRHGGCTFALVTTPVDKSRPSYARATERRTLVVVLLMSFVGAALVASPLLIGLVLGVVLALSTQRAFHAVTKHFHGRRRLAAALVTLASGLVVTGFGIGFVVALANELVRLANYLNEHASSASLAPILGEHAAHAIEHAGVNTAKLYAWLQVQAESAASLAASSVATAVRATGEAILGFLVTLMTMYTMLLEGAELVERIERLVPLEPLHTRALLFEARDVARSAFLGTMVTSLVQGILAGVAYAALGIPQPVLWAAATVLASFFPVAGTALVWGPVVAYLVVDGHIVRAALMTAWGLLVVMALPDYVLRPRLVGGHAHAHPLITLIALLGGFQMFGLIGIIVGPLLMSVFVAAFRLYEREATGLG